MTLTAFFKNLCTCSLQTQNIKFLPCHCDHCYVDLPLPQWLRLVNVNIKVLIRVDAAQSVETHLQNCSPDLKVLLDTISVGWGQQFRVHKIDADLGKKII